MRCGENEKKRKRIKSMNECTQWRIQGGKGGNAPIPPWVSAPPLSSSPKWYDNIAICQSNKNEFFSLSITISINNSYRFWIFSSLHFYHLFPHNNHHLLSVSYQANLVDWLKTLSNDVKTHLFKLLKCTIYIPLKTIEITKSRQPWTPIETKFFRIYLSLSQILVSRTTTQKNILFFLSI